MKPTTCSLHVWEFYGGAIEPAEWEEHEDGSSTLVTYVSRAEANAALKDFLDDMRDAVERGHMDEAPTREEIYVVRGTIDATGTLRIPLKRLVFTAADLAEMRGQSA